MTVPDFFGKYSLEKSIKKIFYDYAYGVSALNLIESIGAVSEKLGFKSFLIGGFPRDVLIYILKSNVETAGHYKSSKVFNDYSGFLDLDVAVEGSSEKLVSFFKNDRNLKFLLNSLNIHERFGTTLAEFYVRGKPLKIDFASLRTEIYVKSGMLPKVDTSATLEEDILRRDFTVNTVAFSINPSNFLELTSYSSGIEDILNKKIKILHEFSFIDDPTRIFRAVRFEKRLGFQIDRITLKLLKNALSQKVLDNISGKRITAELYILFKEKNPEIYFERLNELSVLSSVNQNLRFLKRNKIIIKRMKRYFCEAKNFKILNEIFKNIGEGKKLFYLAGIFYGLNEKESAEVSERLKLGNTVWKSLKKLLFTDRYEIDNLKNDYKEDNVVELYKNLNKIEYKSILFYLFQSEDKKKADLIFRKIVVRYLEKSVLEKPFLKGGDIKAMGICEGPVCGIILNEIKSLKAAGKLKNKADEIKYVESRYLKNIKKN
ncbi:MAG: tRNA nucleotidyltransferase/poly(A) polymerase family protein [bacterium]